MKIKNQPAAIDGKINGPVIFVMVFSQLAPDMVELSSRDTWIWLIADTTVRLNDRRILDSLLAVCGVDEEDLTEMISEIRALDPKPGLAFDRRPIEPVTPDVLLRLAAGEAIGTLLVAPTHKSHARKRWMADQLQLRGAVLMNYFSDPVFRANLPKPPEEDPAAAVRAWAGVFGQVLTWDDMKWLRDMTKLPLVLKGICHPDDARRAIDLGADGIYCSNHGGRQLDSTISGVEGLTQMIPTDRPRTRAECRIERPFLLYTGGDDWRKNIAGLIDVSARLSSERASSPRTFSSSAIQRSSKLISR